MKRKWRSGMVDDGNGFGNIRVPGSRRSAGQQVIDRNAEASIIVGDVERPGVRSREYWGNTYGADSLFRPRRPIPVPEPLLSEIIDAVNRPIGHATGVADIAKIDLGGGVLVGERD